jgi:hypothetical protein
VLAAAGDRDSAIAVARQIATAEARTEPAILIARIYAKLGLTDEFFKWMDRAVAVKSTPLYIGILNEETLPYRSDPRFQRFLTAIGLQHRARV